MHNHKKDFFRRVDAPLSALACNCLQLTCLFPNYESYCVYSSTANTADWMGQFVTDNPDSTTTLRQLVLPGTHDSASGTIGACQPFSAAGRTQNVSVKEQLLAGARYLDVRVATSSSSSDLLSIWHGCLEGGNFRDVLEEIHEFLEEHPQELIVLELVPEYGKKFGNDQKRQCFELAQEVLSSKVIPSSDLRDVIQNKPFVEVITGSKTKTQRVAVLIHGRFFENDFDMKPAQVTEQYGFAMQSQYLCSPWNNSKDTTELLDKNLSNVDKFAQYKGRLMSNQIFATPGVGGVADVLGALIGNNSLRPVSHACKLYESDVLDRFLRQNCDKPWNIISFDFIDLCPDIVEYLIALNWSSRSLTVIKAVAHSNGTDNDVTETIQPFVCRRDRVLFLVDPEKDLGTGEEHFCLTVAYSLTASGDGGGGSQFYVATIDCECDCPVLISAFCCNESALQVEVTEDSGESGVVHRGKLYTTKQEVPDGESGTTLEFHMSGNSCEFNVV